LFPLPFRDRRASLEKASRHGSLRAGHAWIVAACVLAAAVPQVARAAPPAGPPHVDTPAVSDPMLAPPPPAPSQVASWDEALTLLREHSPEYIASYESVERAAAQSRIALAAVLPTLTAQGSYTHQFHTETFSFAGQNIVAPYADTLVASASVQWNIVNPRALYAIGTAHENVRATELSFQDRRRTIALTLVHAMLSTLAASRVAELNRVGLRSALERLVLTQTRLQFGQGTPVDVDRAEQDVAASRATLIAGDETLRQAREALGAALGSTTALSAP